MDFVIAIVLYVILLCMIFMATWRMGIHLFSAATVALLVAAVFLVVLIPPSDLDKFTNDMIDGCNNHEKDNVAVGIICSIYIVTLVVILWYVLAKAAEDRVPCF